MRSLTLLFLAMAAPALAACVIPRPLDLGDDHPGNAAAASGFVDTPTALGDYKTPEDFAARATADAKQPSGHSGHDMSGMHDMRGMHHGATPQGAGEQ
jgi:hypothetical protein